MSNADKILKLMQSLRYKQMMISAEKTKMEILKKVVQKSKEAETTPVKNGF